MILNKCFGGFVVSGKCYDLYAKKKGIVLHKYLPEEDGDDFVKVTGERKEVFTRYTTKDYGDRVKVEKFDWRTCIQLDGAYRTDGALIECIEELGDEASVEGFSELRIVEVPDDLNYVVDEYDGLETLHEAVRTW